MIAVAAAVLLALAMQAAPDAAELIAQPDWEKVPPPMAFVRLYPKAALAQRLDGTGVVRCRVTKRGTLEDCAILEERPANAGFGEAALKMTPMFRMRPTTKDGKPSSGGLVRIPIRFQITYG